MSDDDVTSFAPADARPLHDFIAWFARHRRANGNDEDELIEAYLASIEAGAVFTLTAEIDNLLRRNLPACELRALGLWQPLEDDNAAACRWLHDVRHRLAQ